MSDLEDGSVERRRGEGDDDGAPRAGPSGDDPQLESLCRHTVERMRLDGAAEEQKQLQASVPDKEPSPFQRLPDELHGMVFSHLSPRELCTSVLPVCRQWYELGRDPVLWQHLSFDGRTCSTSTVVNILSFSTLLKSLMLERWWPVNDILSQVADTCHQLRSLAIRSCSFDSPLLETIVQRCPLIERVHFDDMDINLHDVGWISALKGLNHLKVLATPNMSPVCMSNLFNILRCFTHLQELDLSAFYILKAFHVQELVAQAGNRLLSLKINGWSFTDAGFQALGGCHNLQELYISNARRLTDVGVMALASLHGLMRLHIVQAYHGSSAAFARLFAGQNMPLLLHLDLSECSNVDDGTVDALTANCPRLRYLALSWCGKITDAGLELIVTRLHSLRDLDLIFAWGITKRTFPEGTMRVRL